MQPLCIIYIHRNIYISYGNAGNLQTLQKSIDLTPLLPSAGPTGGLGLAWPAPTISLTMVSTPPAAPFAALDMVGVALRRIEAMRNIDLATLMEIFGRLKSWSNLQLHPWEQLALVTRRG